MPWQRWPGRPLPGQRQQRGASTPYSDPLPGTENGSSQQPWDLSPGHSGPPGTTGHPLLAEQRAHVGSPGPRERRARREGPETAEAERMPPQGSGQAGGLGSQEARTPHGWLLCPQGRTFLSSPARNVPRALGTSQELCLRRDLGQWTGQRCPGALKTGPTLSCLLGHRPGPSGQGEDKGRGG